MPVLLTKCLSIKVTDEDYARFEALAGEQRVGAWARDILLHAVAAQPVEVIILAELLAVRVILLNLHFSLANGNSPTIETMQRLIDLADSEKLGKARDRLHAHHL